jgi:enoyl-CoA hydratase/carnithine racemase
MSEVVEVAREGALWWVTINRPEALNAVSFEVMAGLEAVCSAALLDEEVRVIALRGAGSRAFISGGDLREFSALVTRRDAMRMALRMRSILEAFEALDVWVIACINGDAYGGGCETLLACDVRIAAPGARLGFTQARFYVPPGWGGLTRLVERVGRGRALMWLGGEAVVSAQEAHTAGLVEEVCGEEGVEARVREVAGRLMRQDRAMIGALKRCALRAVSASRADAMAEELEAFADFWASEEHQRRVAAFLEL